MNSLDHRHPFAHPLRTLGAFALPWTLAAGCAAGGPNSGTQDEPDRAKCSAYFPVDQTGAVWTYNSGWTFPYVNGDTTAVASVDTDGHPVRTETWTFSESGDPTEYDASRVTTYRCDGDGVKVASTVEWDGLTDLTWTNTYDPPVLVVPTDPQIGDHWSTEFTGTSNYYTDPNGEPQTQTLSGSVAFTVDREDFVSVPAGDFWTIVLAHQHESYSIRGILSSTWLASDVGMVKTDGDTTLLSFEP